MSRVRKVGGGILHWLPRPTIKSGEGGKCPLCTAPSGPVATPLYTGEGDLLKNCKRQQARSASYAIPGMHCANHFTASFHFELFSLVSAENTVLVHFSIRTTIIVVIVLFYGEQIFSKCR